MAKRQYTWDPVSDSILEETDGAGAVLASYTTEPARFGRLVSQHHDGQSAYFHFDALGSARAVTEASENVTDTFAYDAWGVTVHRIGLTETVFQWLGAIGYDLDSSIGLFQVRRRTYRSLLARWTSRDPHQGRRFGVERPYVYSSNSPINNIDPSGLLDWKTTERSLGNCGAYTWVTQFFLGNGERDGVIAQLVCVTVARHHPCNPNSNCQSQIRFRPAPCSAQHCFYEMWRVVNGQIFLFTSIDEVPANVGDADAFTSVSCADCTRGALVASGTAFFIPEATFDANIDDFRRLFPSNGNLGAASGSVSACGTTEVRDFMSQFMPPQPLRKGVRRFWNCCCRRRSGTCGQICDYNEGTITYSPDVPDL